MCGGGPRRGVLERAAGKAPNDRSAHTRLPRVLAPDCDYHRPRLPLPRQRLDNRPCAVFALPPSFAIDSPRPTMKKGRSVTHKSGSSGHVTKSRPKKIGEPNSYTEAWGVKLPSTEKIGEKRLGQQHDEGERRVKMMLAGESSSPLSVDLLTGFSTGFDSDLINVLRGESSGTSQGEAQPQENGPAPMNEDDDDDDINWVDEAVDLAVDESFKHAMADVSDMLRYVFRTFS